MATDEEKNLAISCLKFAIEDTQETIRAYDNKAEILGILLTLAIGITNYALFEHSAGCSKKLLLGSWLIALVAIAIAGLVLHPKKNPFKSIALGSYTPSGTFFLANLSSSPQDTVTAMVVKAVNTDWVSELMYESMKLSAIRDYKHNCFKWAVRLSGITIIMIIASVIMLTL